MAMRDRIYGYTDRPMTWTRAIVLGLIIWAIAILLLGQVPSVIIYKADQEVAAIIEFSKKIPGVNGFRKNGSKKEPTVQLPVVSITKANYTRLFKDKFLKKSEVCIGEFAKFCK